MSQTRAPLVGSVFERTPSNSSSPKFTNASKTGFPAAQHRSKSAFARGRDDLRKSGGINRSRPQEVPAIHSPRTSAGLESNEREERSSPRPTGAAQDVEEMRQQISEENERRVDAMTEEERAQEVRDIIERFGAGMGDLLKRVKNVREARERDAGQESVQAPITDEQTNTDMQANKLATSSGAHSSDGSRSEVDERLSSHQRSQGVETSIDLSSYLHNGIEPHHIRSKSPPSPRPILSNSSTRPSSRTGRALRFAEVTPADIHFYESAPPSPRKKVLALPPPPDVKDESIISLGQWKGKLRAPAMTSEAPHGPSEAAQDKAKTKTEPEEGSPEDIRRRFFPDVPARDPNLAWIETPVSDTSSSSLRFDLTGTPIPSTLSKTLPTHLGLHHHADGLHAGYTMDDIFLLSRSSVPAQRVSMLDVLSRIARRLAKGKAGTTDQGIAELAGQEEDLRKRIIALGVEAMGERGSLGARAVQVMWDCIVGWDEDYYAIEGVELKGTDEKDTISTLPLDFILSRTAEAFNLSTLPSETLSQLLAILHRLAQHSNDIAESIVSTPKLIAGIIQAFLLAPVTPVDSSRPPDPAALQLLNTLALASRSNASALTEPADALLRFVVMVPPTSSYPTPLANTLIAGTLRLYETLASYGLYSHVATTAMEPLARLEAYVQSDGSCSRNVMQVWTELLGVWTVCATDPHQTTPPHDILWSQVVGWNWAGEVLKLKNRLSDEENDWDIWSSIWGMETAWLEGCRVNALKGGEGERYAAIEAFKPGFEAGTEATVVMGVVRGLQRGLRDFYGSTVSFATNLEILQKLAKYARIATSSLRLWLSCLPSSKASPLPTPPFSLPFQQLGEVCSQLVKHPFWSLDHGKIPSGHRVFCRSLTALLTCYLDLSRWLPSTTEDLLMAQTFAILTRLLPGDEESGIQIIGKLDNFISEASVARHGWQLPAVVFENPIIKLLSPFLTHAVRPNSGAYIGPLQVSPTSILACTTQRLARASRGDLGLLLTRDWVFSPLDHLLQSGSSSVIKALPESWASETELVRAMLVLAKTSWIVLQRFSLSDLAIGREDAIFGCMKVFMLEHGQLHDDSQEVFRDSIVGQLMADVVAPFSFAASPPAPSCGENLEKVASRFLGPSTPFYQYYTDFVALYDSISFSHPLFARLLLPPTSMRYAQDYRKHLWNDFGHVIKTIRTPVEQVLTSDLEEFLWPIENDPQMISAYLKALVKSPLEGFVRFAAIHHIACSIWPDARDEGGGEERASKLLLAVVNQGDLGTVREIVQYRQNRDRPLLPPLCFEQEGDWKTRRLEFIEQWGGARLLEQLGVLLRDNNNVP